MQNLIIIGVVALCAFLFLSTKKKEVETPPTSSKPKINRASTDLLIHQSNDIQIDWSVFNDKFNL